MSTRATRDNSSSVGLFPFLAVLLCTMGALLVLLVVLAQQAGQRVADGHRQAPIATLSSPVDAAAAAELLSQLEEVREYQQKLQQIREQGEERLQDAQQRLSHLEEHARRLEHELAKLSLASQQLEATEKSQSVDREQADHEAERLRQLIVDTEKQLEELRKESSGERSYSIIPYKGQNGTQRRPIYIECSAEGIVLQPEGLRFQSSDFAALSWPGNPLAAALRATREHLIAQAARAGKPEPPDPYPLILVRPEGTTQFLVAKRAITSWDSDYGYEFIDGDWKLDFPDLPDPQLAQAQQHAVMIARERLARLARAAPSRFRGIGVGAGNGRGGGTGGSRGTGQGLGRYADSAPDEGALARAGDGNSASGNGSTAGIRSQQPDGSATGEFASANDEFQHGMLGGEPSQGSAGSDSFGGGPGGQSGEATDEIAGTSADGSAFGSPSGQSGSSAGAAQQATGQAGGSASGSAEGANASSAGRSDSGGQPGQPSEDGGAPSLQFTSPQSESIAESRGSDWAVQQAMRGSVPIKRPIQVVVREDQISLLPTRHATQGIEATGTVISLNQSLDQVSNEFVAALKTRIDEWGLAGNGLYWRPVLELHVGPDAGKTTSKIIQLLKNSGVEVHLPKTAEAPDGERANASR